MEPVPDELKERYYAMLATGFPNWMSLEFKLFLNAFLEAEDPFDIELI